MYNEALLQIIILKALVLLIGGDIIQRWLYVYDCLWSPSLLSKKAVATTLSLLEIKTALFFQTKTPHNIELKHLPIFINYHCSSFVQQLRQSTCVLTKSICDKAKDLVLSVRSSSCKDKTHSNKLHQTVLILIEQTCVSLYISQLGSAWQDLLANIHYLPMITQEYLSSGTTVLAGNKKHYKINSQALLDVAILVLLKNNMWVMFEMCQCTQENLHAFVDLCMSIELYCIW